MHTPDKHWDAVAGVHSVPGGSLDGTGVGEEMTDGIGVGVLVGEGFTVGVGVGVGGVVTVGVGVGGAVMVGVIDGVGVGGICAATENAVKSRNRAPKQNNCLKFMDKFAGRRI